MLKAVIYSDGASSGNPGPAGIGAVLNIGERKITISEPIGEATNNIAEYKALIKALKTALEHNVRGVTILLDSELIVKQIKGVYRVKNRGLIPLFAEVNNLLGEFQHYTINHIPREKNKEADALAKKAVKTAIINKGAGEMVAPD